MSPLPYYAFGNGQVLSGLSGNVNGDASGYFVLGSGSMVYPGGFGGIGSLTFNSLKAPSSSSLKFNLSSSASGANDSITVNSHLVLNAPTFHLAAPSTGATMDTSDYVLMTSPNQIVGYPNSTPVWDVVPAGAADYSVTISQTYLGYSVILHHSAGPPPVVGAFANPFTNLVHGETVTFTVVVTNQSASIDPNNGVFIDLTAYGAQSVLPLINNGANEYTNTTTIPDLMPTGPVTVFAQVVDGNGATATAPINLYLRANTYVWSGADAVNGNSTWEDALNWAGGFSPGLIGDNVTFTGSQGLDNTFNYGDNYTLNGLTFDSHAGPFVISPPYLGSLTITGGITNNAPVLEILTNFDSLNNASFNLGSPITSIYDNGAAGLDLDAQINLNGYTLNIVDSGPNVVTVIGDSGLGGNGQTPVGLTGTGNLAMNGTGIALLVGDSANGWTGNIQVGNGTVMVDSNNTTINGNIIITNGAFVIGTNGFLTSPGQVEGAFTGNIVNSNVFAFYGASNASGILESNCGAGVISGPGEHYGPWSAWPTGMGGRLNCETTW